MRPKKRFGGFSFYLILMLVIFAMTYFMSNMSGGKGYTLSEVRSLIENEKVESVVINGSSLKMVMKSVNGQPQEVITKEIPLESIGDYEKYLAESADKGLIKSYDYNRPTDISSILNILIIVMLLASIGVFIYINYSRQGDGKSAISFGKSRAKLNDPSKNKVTFADVAGAEEEKEELQEIVDFLKNPKKYSDLGAKMPRGIMLVGAPGTGKTLLAKAVAGEASVPFFSISGSDFVEMFVGVGASRVRDLFDNAKKRAPSIIFIDEIDAVGRHRGAGLGGGHDEREQTLNQLLVEMDGFGPNEGVIVMAATNRPDILDPALLRPGRFDRRVVVMSPDLIGREAILQVHARNKPLAADVDLSNIAKITPGFTGADLANLLNEAALLTARRGGKEIENSDITEAVFKITIGPEKKSRIISDEERRLTAFHESGHAIVIRVASTRERVERVSIIPAGGAGGYTAFKPEEDMYFQTKSQLITKIMIALGGRAAEELTFGELSTGASQDLQQCNKIARNMVTNYGMSERLGNFVVDKEQEVFLGRDYTHTQQHSESLSAVIDEEVKRILDEAYERTLAILRENHEMLKALANRLLEVEKVESEEFEELYRQYAANYQPLSGDEEKIKLVSGVEQDPQAEKEAEKDTEAVAEAETVTETETETETET
ncbi:MAG: ATP-dependent zinc metalloprotease FtsH [Saccharofermentanales bacterium]|jgi:cell division protease FtsH|nr:ATP-dependent zinc metalloprotease FtsH [Bacillota bacterium]NLB09318.1 ATP-dependent zinc metalloprotease FtsH [Clostridiales bacterium]